MKYIVPGAIALTTLPFLLLFGNLDLSMWSTDREIFLILASSSVASVFGFIGIILFLWQIVLGSRPVSRLFGPDIIGRIGLHKKIGIYGGLLVLLHPLLILYAYSESLLFLVWPTASFSVELYIGAGRLAFVLFLVIYFTSAVLRGKMRYRPWRYIHYLTYPMVFFGLVHSFNVGSTFARLPWLQTVWQALMVAFLAYVLYRVLFALGVGKKRYTIAGVEAHPGGVTILRLTPNKKGISPRVGQYSYLSLGRMGESHPFSVMKYDEASGELTYGIRTSGPFTKKVAELKEGGTLFVDGPYGVFTVEGHNEAPKVLIAGGIGITPFVDVVRRYSTEDTYLLNCNRTLDGVVLRDELKGLLHERYTDIVSDEAAEGAQVVTGRLSADVIGSRVPKEVLEKANVFFCGPPAMYQAVLKMVGDLGVPPSRVYYEEFSL